MATVTFKNTTVQIKGSMPAKGEKAPAFQLTTQDLKETGLEAFAGKKKLLNIFPSLDTDVCAQTVKKFHEQCASIEDLVVLNISMDLPFAAGRFCTSHHLNQAITLSAFRSNFADEYGVRIAEGPLRGLCTRAVIIIDENDTVLESFLVPEITQEPNYSQILEKLQSGSFPVN